MYVDATHEVTVVNGKQSVLPYDSRSRSRPVLTALNLSTFAADGPLPYDHIPPKKKRSFITHEVAPFATNVQFQRELPHFHWFFPITNFTILVCSVLSCASTPGPQIRVIVNDAPVPLSPLKYCPDETKYGLCPVDGFVSSLKEIIRETDFAWGCLGQYDLPDGDAWQTVNGTPPPKPKNYTLQARDSGAHLNEKRWEWPLVQEGCFM